MHAGRQADKRTAICARQLGGTVARRNLDNPQLMGAMYKIYFRVTTSFASNTAHGRRDGVRICLPLRHHYDDDSATSSHAFGHDCATALPRARHERATAIAQRIAWTLLLRRYGGHSWVTTLPLLCSSVAATAPAEAI